MAVLFTQHQLASFERLWFNLMKNTFCNFFSGNFLDKKKKADSFKSLKELVNTIYVVFRVGKEAKFYQGA